MKNQAELPIISIGLPVYNGGKYIEDAINSVLKQSFINFELIISDNASNDDTGKICSEYANRDCRIKYILQETNIGAVPNFKFVLDKARGHFFKWLAHDDYIESEDYLSVMLDKIALGYDYCFSEVDIVSENNNGKQTRANIMDRFLNCNDLYSFSFQTIYICSYQFYGVFRRDLLTQNFSYFSDCSHLKCFNEGLLVHVMAAKFRAVYVPSVKFIYRRHGENWSLSVDEYFMILDFFKFTYMILSFYAGKFTGYSFIQRIKLIAMLTAVHGRYSLILIAKYITSTRYAFSKSV